MSQKNVQELKDWCLWYYEHRDVIRRNDRSPEQKWEFLAKALDGVFDMLSRHAEDVTDLEGRPRESLGRALWTPGAIRVRGDVRKFG